MKTDIIRLDDREERRYIEAFEEACRSSPELRVEAFVPNRDHPHYLTVLRELICIDIERGYSRRHPTTLEEYQARFPELFADRKCLEEILFEDYRQRQRMGEEISPEQYERYGIDISFWHLPSTQVRSDDPPEKPKNFPAYDYLSSLGEKEELQAPGELLEDSRLAQMVEAAATLMPEPGAMFGGFRLLKELGRGAFSRVYLAQEQALANRLVALKISTEHFNESQALAQLQHTNIVPVFSVHRFRDFQGICMPYFGATTLADVLRDLRSTAALPKTGRAFLGSSRFRSSEVEGRSGLLPSSDPRDPAISPSAMANESAASTDLISHREELFGHLTYQQSVLWLAVRLSSGLAHAHERGILHRDLKPANILLTDAGEPMLLDFNLSLDLQEADSPAQALLGGTLPYMAPEHLRAFQGSEEEVGAQADIYSLGLILYELATGKSAAPSMRGNRRQVLQRTIEERSKPLPDPRTIAKDVSPSFAAILNKCLQPDCNERYQTAQQLHEDLKRELEDMPLAHAQEPLLRARARKWSRRHPKLALAIMAMIAIALCLTLVLKIQSESAKRAAERERRLDLEAQRHFTTLIENLPTIQFRLFDNRDAKKPSGPEGISLARTLLEPFGGATEHMANSPVAQRLTEEQRTELQESTGELLVLIAQARLLSSEKEEEAIRKAILCEALRENEVAEALFSQGHPKALFIQRAELFDRLGQKEKAQGLLERAAGLPMQSSRDRYLLARCYSTRGSQRRALALLDQAIADNPSHFWSWFLKGYYHSILMQNGKAISAYSVCIALEPELYAPYFERGLAYLREQRYGQARGDFLKVLKGHPEDGDAYLNLGLAQQGEENHQEAIASFTQALKHSPGMTRLYFLRSRAYQLAGKAGQAQEDHQEGLKQEPTDAISWVSRGVARLRDDPNGALADYQQALELNPRSSIAMQNMASVLSERLSKPEEALNMLDRLIKLYPDYLPAHRGRAVLLARQGKRSEAHAEAKKSLELTHWQTDDPRQIAKTWYYVACTYALTSRLEKEDQGEAIDALTSALRRGFGHDYLEKDPDLAPIRNEPELRKLIDAVRAMRKKR